MIHELLQKWAQLQPDWCEEEKGYGFWVGSPAEHCYSIYKPQENLDFQQLSTLQGNLQKAIASHNARLRLENSPEGWHVTIAKPALKGTNLEILVFGKENEPALAILSAWVEYLEIEQTAAQPQVSL